MNSNKEWSKNVLVSKNNKQDVSIPWTGRMDFRIEQRIRIKHTNGGFLGILTQLPNVDSHFVNMSDSEELNFCQFGTPLEPYDEDEFPKKKAFSIEDQIATDDHGRRRFHGAFTGGFSAGFFNTVGSLEGWTPSEFKSSRGEKAEKRDQKPEDFMDEEDTGEFGIAPKVLRTKSDYTSGIKRKRNPAFTDGPIPGVPVLHVLLQPARETVGVKLLKRMGWKPGQGVGPRQTKVQKRKTKHKRKETGRIYGCELPAGFGKQNRESTESESSEEEVDLTFAPDDYEPYIVQPKDNTFGLGYSGLDKRAILSSHISLFEPSKFKVQDRNNKKLSISGQAFGVGAFEMEDEDIYSKDDMSRYDFELDSAKPKLKKPEKKIVHSGAKIVSGFVPSKESASRKKMYPPPEVPKTFVPKHGARKTRFEPLPETHKLYNYDRRQAMGRHDLTASDREKIINDKPKPSILDAKPQESEKLVEKAKKITSTLPTTKLSVEGFKPFAINPEKQARYEQYLKLVKLGQGDELEAIQPASMSKWEREKEKMEFVQAARMFKATRGLVFDRFVTAKHADDEEVPERKIEENLKVPKAMWEAAKKSQFGSSTRKVYLWKPNGLVCKRFNVPQPHSGLDVIEPTKKTSKYTIYNFFESLMKNNPQEEEVEPASYPSTSKQIETSPCVDDIQSTGSNKPELVPTRKKSKILADIPDFSKINKLNSNTEKPQKIEPPKELPENNTQSLKPVETIDTEKIVKLPQPVQPVIDLDEPINVAAKVDLYREIFLSSDSEDEKEEEEDKTEKMKQLMLEETISLPTVKTKKTGILSNINLENISTESKVDEPEKDETVDTTNKEEVDDLTYGPKIPPPQLIQKSNSISFVPRYEPNDEWVEKDEHDKKKHKSKKKHKDRDKSKHKKHKSKHKRKHNFDSD